MVCSCAEQIIWCKDTSKKGHNIWCPLLVNLSLSSFYIISENIALTWYRKHKKNRNMSKKMNLVNCITKLLDFSLSLSNQGSGKCELRLQLVHLKHSYSGLASYTRHHSTISGYGEVDSNRANKYYYLSWNCTQLLITSC